MAGNGEKYKRNDRRWDLFIHNDVFVFAEHNGTNFYLYFFSV